MIRISITELKAHFSGYLRRVLAGETITIRRRNRPFAEIRPLSKADTEPRPIGLAKGKVEVTDRFFEPLPEEEVNRFNGET